jgi:hypothetical protein
MIFRNGNGEPAKVSIPVVGYDYEPELIAEEFQRSVLIAYKNRRGAKFGYHASNLQVSISSNRIKPPILIIKNSP